MEITNNERSQIEHLLPLPYLREIASRAKGCVEMTENPLLRHELLNLACAASHAEIIVRGCIEDDD
ncbi:MAG: hypothetical protein ACLP7I_12185 [Limisphaerales bacterium]